MLFGKPKKAIMIRRFVAVWVFYWVLFVVMPLDSTHGNSLVAFILQLIFVVLVLSAVVFARQFAPAITFITYPNISQIRMQSRLVAVSIFISMLGFMLLVYDKQALQGVDYSEGLANAREQWRHIGEEREGAASSIYSAIGYLIGSSYFFGAILLVSRRIYFTDKFRFISSFLIFILTMLNSIITGGRSSILLLAAFVFSSYCVNKSGYKRKLFETNIYSLVIVIFIVTAIFYMAYIFSLRSEASDSTIQNYVEGFLPYLNLEPTATYSYIIEKTGLGSILSALSLCGAYLTHSLVTTALIIDSNETGGIVIMGHIANLLYKTGLIESVNRDWFLAGRFPSFPGGVYYQMGLSGVFFIAIILGFCSVFIERLIRKYGNSPMILICYCATEAILVLSPLLFAADLLSFPFVITGGVISIIIVKTTGLWKKI